DGIFGLDIQVFDKHAGQPLAVAGIQLVPFGNVLEFDDQRLKKSLKKMAATTNIDTNVTYIILLILLNGIHTL
ncbi:MAG: hypothetical protein IIV47_01125, partial [Clostridia bacterium]|nr:hypothetical protein [Clostridia bacterium]